MKFILLTLIFNISISNQEISAIRESYLLAYISESNCDHFGEKIIFNTENSPLVKGYLGCFYFIKSKFETNPIDKFYYFKKGRSLLEAAIHEDPTSVELIFLRYSIQKNLPQFLLYNNTEKDLIFVDENLSKVSDQKTKKFILNCMKLMKK